MLFKAEWSVQEQSSDNANLCRKPNIYSTSTITLLVKSGTNSLAVEQRTKSDQMTKLKFITDQVNYLLTVRFNIVTDLRQKCDGVEWNPVTYVHK